MATVTVEVDCKEIEGTLRGEAFGQFLANRALEYMEPFVPYDTGDLSKSAVATPFQVTYDKDYASKVYEGVNMVIKQDADKHPLACSHWDEAMEAAHIGELAQDATDYLRR